MKKILFISLTSILFLSANGQSNKFNFGLKVFPSMTKGLIIDNGTGPNSIAGYIGSNEFWKPSVSGHVFIEYAFNERFSINFGMGYENNGERSLKLPTTFGLIPDPDDPTAVRFVKNRHNVEVPLNANYYFNNRIYLTIGSSLLINTYNSSASIMYFDNKKNERNTTEDKSTEYRLLNGTVNFGFGFEKELTAKTSLIIQPHFQVGIQGVAIDVPVNRRPLSVGLIIGIKI